MTQSQPNFADFEAARRCLRPSSATDGWQENEDENAIYQIRSHLVRDLFECRKRLASGHHGAGVEFGTWTEIEAIPQWVFLTSSADDAVTIEDHTGECPIEPSIATFLSLIGCSAFEALDAARDPAIEISRRIAAFRTGSRLPYRRNLAQRLEQLLTAGIEEEIWNTESPQSLRFMFQFLEANTSLRAPTITITPDSVFRVEWTNSPNEHLAISFRSDGQARFVVFCASPQNPNKIRRVTGLSPWDSLKRDLAAYDLSRWGTPDARTQDI